MTAIGTYRTTEGTGPIDRVMMDRRGYSRERTDWDDFTATAPGYAAFDRYGCAWRVTEAEAAAIESSKDKGDGE